MRSVSVGIGRARQLGPRRAIIAVSALLPDQGARWGLAFATGLHSVVPGCLLGNKACCAPLALAANPRDVVIAQCVFLAGRADARCRGGRRPCRRSSGRGSGSHLVILLRPLGAYVRRGERGNRIVLRPLCGRRTGGGGAFGSGPPRGTAPAG